MALLLNKCFLYPKYLRHAGRVKIMSISYVFMIFQIKLVVVGSGMILQSGLVWKKLSSQTKLHKSIFYGNKSNSPDVSSLIVLCPWLMFIWKYSVVSLANKVQNDHQWRMIHELLHMYASHHFTPHGEIWTHLIDLAPNAWLHSSVCRASHRYRGGHGLESC